MPVQNTGSKTVQGDQEIRARFSNQKKNMKAANKCN
jgi:hypothetical protein